MLASYSNAQLVKVEDQVSLESIKVIELEVGGATTIIRNDQRNLKVTSSLTPHGTVFGWSFDKERPTFTIEHTMKADTLVLKAPKKWNQKIIGVDLYSEDIETIICLPENMNVIISSADKLIIDNNFQRLKVLRSRSIELNRIDKTHVGLVICNASRKLTIGGLKYKLNHEIEGTGTGYYLLKAETIFIY